MTDSTQHRGSPDNKEFNVHEDYELRDWAAKWGVTKQDVLDAHKACGSKSAAMIEAQLRKAGKIR